MMSIVGVSRSVLDFEGSAERSLYFTPAFLGDFEYIKDLEDPDGVQEKHRYEPFFVIVLYRGPNSVNFPRDSPQEQHDDQQGRECI